MTAYEELKAWCEKHLVSFEEGVDYRDGEEYPYIDIKSSNEHSYCGILFNDKREIDQIDIGFYDQRQAALKENRG